MTNFTTKLSLLIIFLTFNNAWGANSVPQEEDPNFKALARFVRFSSDARELHNALSIVPSETSEGFGEFINSLLVHTDHPLPRNVVTLIPLVSDIAPGHRHTFSACISALLKHAHFSGSFETIVSGFKSIPPFYWRSLIPIAEDIKARPHGWASDIIKELTAYVTNSGTTASPAFSVSEILIDNVRALSMYIRCDSDRIDLINALKGTCEHTGTRIRTLLLQGIEDCYLIMDDIIKLIPLVSVVEEDHRSAFFGIALPLFSKITSSGQAAEILSTLLEMPRNYLEGFKRIAEIIAAKESVKHNHIIEAIRNYTPTDLAEEEMEDGASASSSSSSSSSARASSEQGAAASASSAAAASPAAATESGAYAAADPNENYIKKILGGSRLASSSLDDLSELVPLVSMLEEEHRETFLAAATPLFKHVAYNCDAIRLIKELLAIPRGRLTDFVRVAQSIHAKSWMSVSNIIAEIRRHNPARTAHEPSSSSRTGAASASSSSSSASASSADETPEDNQGAAPRLSQTQIDLRLRQFVFEHFGNLIHLGGSVHTQQRDYNEFVLIPLSASGAALTEYIVVLRLGHETGDETPDKEESVQNFLRSNPYCRTLYNRGLSVDGKKIATGKEVIDELLITLRAEKSVADYLQSKDFINDFRKRKQGQTWIDVLDEHFE